MAAEYTVGCIGAGVIGSSWATCFAMHGCKVNVYDIKEEFLTRACERINDNITFLVSKGYYSEEKKEEALKRITYTTSLQDALKDVSFIQESGPENYEAKRAIIQTVDKFAPPEAVYASSTSGLLITEIASVSEHPERCVGGHPYNPPHLIPLVEITRGKKTGQEYLDKAKQFYQEMGKEPIVLQKETLGFIANRIQVAVGREVCELVERGVCSIEDTDKAICFGPGLRWAIMGQNLINQLGGGDGGVRRCAESMGKSAELWLSDMAKWDKFPDNWVDLQEAGIKEEMANRSPEQGNTNEEIIKYRDDKLLGILHLLGKL